VGVLTPRLPGSLVGALRAGSGDGSGRVSCPWSEPRTQQVWASQRRDINSLHM